MDQWIIGLIDGYNGYGMALFVLITTLCSAFLSCLFGIEREIVGQSAGLRTHVLVSIGCSLLMTISMYALKSSGLSYDASRIAAGVVSGIGFLCAGAIIKIGISVKGLTTAATLWICSAIGLACGSGFVLEAIVGAGVSFLFLRALIYVEKYIEKRCPQVKIIVTPNINIISLAHEIADPNRIIIKKISTDGIKDDKGNDMLDVTIQFAYKTAGSKVKYFIDQFKSKDGIAFIQYKNLKK